MSNRFHNKYHRHNHHTTPISDLRYPDASHDPIASHESPFLGDFVLNGTLSGLQTIQSLSSFESYGTALFAPSITGINAIDTIGNVSVQGVLSAQDINLTGNVITTYTGDLSAVTLSATGEFLILNAGGVTRAIRLWSFDI
jgi:hypothetical protein